MALRIKDNVDLKELEKFGFEKIHSFDNSIYELYRKCYGMTEWGVCDFSIYVEHMKKGKIIGVCSTGEYELNELDILYDLITAGIVEKV